MIRLRLRTQLLIATLCLICAVTGASLLVVRRTVRNEVAEQVQTGISASVRAFESVQRQRELQLARTAEMLAELPPLKSLMTIKHVPTIQDGSTTFWTLSGSDMLVLGTVDGQLMAFHRKSDDWSAQQVEGYFKQSIRNNEAATWWYDDGVLYWVFLKPITSGKGREEHQLGWVAVGYQVDANIAHEMARVAGSEIVLSGGGQLIASTLTNVDRGVLKSSLLSTPQGSNNMPGQIWIGDRQFQAASVVLHSGTPTAVRCFVLLPLDRSASFLRRLNWTLLLLGLGAVVGGALIFTFISRAVARPLENLVAGVRALAGGDYAYSIKPQGSTEVAQLGEAFASMRTRLLESQRHQIEVERMAALGRTASSISHDLRHYLAAVVANAEFLFEADSLRLDREEIYREIMLASDQMTDLIDSLRELSHEHGIISPEHAEIDTVVRRAVDAVRARPEYRSCHITVVSEGDMAGVFDSRKLERVFFNLLLNSCEAEPTNGGEVVVLIRSSEDVFEVQVRDNGSGIPQNIRDTLFDPFVSSGKPGGTGLGLAIVSKIVKDHGGTVEVAATSSSGTVICVRIPRAPMMMNSPAELLNSTS